MSNQDAFVTQVHEVFRQLTSGPDKSVTLERLAQAVEAIIGPGYGAGAYGAAHTLREQGWIIVEDGTWSPSTQLFRRDELI